LIINRLDDNKPPESQKCKIKINDKVGIGMQVKKVHFGQKRLSGQNGFLTKKRATSRYFQTFASHFERPLSYKQRKAEIRK